MKANILQIARFRDRKKQQELDQWRKKTKEVLNRIVKRHSIEPDLLGVKDNPLTDTTSPI